MSRKFYICVWSDFTCNASQIYIYIKDNTLKAYQHLIKICFLQFWSFLNNWQNLNDLFLFVGIKGSDHALSVINKKKFFITTFKPKNNFVYGLILIVYYFMCIYVCMCVVCIILRECMYMRVRVWNYSLIKTINKIFKKFFIFCCVGHFPILFIILSCFISTNFCFV